MLDEWTFDNDQQVSVFDEDSGVLRNLTVPGRPYGGDNGDIIIRMTYLVLVIVRIPPCSERTPEKFVTKTVLVARSESIICVADIGRNNGVCSDPEISLLTASTANNLVFRGTAHNSALTPPRSVRSSTPILSPSPELNLLATVRLRLVGSNVRRGLSKRSHRSALLSATYQQLGKQLNGIRRRGRGGEKKKQKYVES
ncbi:hypothetical protein EAG_06833 [Camponotus floridanus]|uniref:Uncharacterized protein n=1 Tax=Camponotus floridanus TaxID=104421 RepID=E2A1H6_CAMFO|nr:hypothetical protein EAG_06833 [Camponotus floridanus]